MNKPLKLFVLFSFVTHLLFGLLWPTQPENNIPWQSSDDISIVITQITTKKKFTPPIPRKTKLLQKKENTKNTSNQDVAKKAPSPSTNLVIRSKVIAQLKRKLLSNFYYPKLAQKKNWEGKVTIGFLLHTTGQLSQIEIIHSSGYQILDNAAIKAISNITKLSEINVNKNMNIQLPITYQLTEG